MISRRLARWLLVLGVAVSGGLFAQSSPNFTVTNAGVVSTAGEAQSPNFQAGITGGEGAPSQSASSPIYAVVIGAGNPDPVNAEAIFKSGFEG